MVGCWLLVAVRLGCLDKYFQSKRYLGENIFY
jgi:hypothetical protein